MSSHDIQKEEPAPSVEEGPGIEAALSAILHELRRTNRLLRFFYIMMNDISPTEVRELAKLTEGL